MKRLFAISVLAPALLAACDEPQTGPSFKSEKERACYNTAAANLDSANKSLERAQDGAFVVVTRINGFVRDIDPSEEFERCMISTGRVNTGPVVQDSAISLNKAEKAQWDKLADADKRAALIFIQKGGTLTQYLAQR